MCYARYRAHLIIIKHTHNTTNSTDADLSILIDRIKSEMCATSDVHTVDQAISYVADFSAVYMYIYMLARLCGNRMLSYFQMYMIISTTSC